VGDHPYRVEQQSGLQLLPGSGHGRKPFNHYRGKQQIGEGSTGLPVEIEDDDELEEVDGSIQALNSLSSRAVEFKQMPIGLSQGRRGGWR